MQNPKERVIMGDMLSCEGRKMRVREMEGAMYRGKNDCGG